MNNGVEIIQVAQVDERAIGVQCAGKLQGAVQQQGGQAWLGGGLLATGDSDGDVVRVA